MVLAITFEGPDCWVAPSGYCTVPHCLITYNDVIAARIVSCRYSLGFVQSILSNVVELAQFLKNKMPLLKLLCGLYIYICFDTLRVSANSTKRISSTSLTLPYIISADTYVHIIVIFKYIHIFNDRWYRPWDTSITAFKLIYEILLN